VNGILIGWIMAGLFGGSLSVEEEPWLFGARPPFWLQSGIRS
jgi:hypothetical protein